MTTLDQNNPGNRTASTDTIANDLKSASADASASLQQKTKQHLEENRTSAASEIEKVAHATRAAAEDLRQQERDGLSTYVAELADNVSSFAQTLRHKSVDELIHEAERIARNNPALFIGGSIAIGLGIARFAKASSHRSQEHQQSRAQSHSMSSHSRARPEVSSGNSSTLTGTSTGTLTGSSALDSNYTEEDWLGSASPGNTGLPKSENNGANTMGGTRYE